MTQLYAEQCELTYEGAFVKPWFSLIDTPGKLCDVLLEALEAFGCTTADLDLSEGELIDRGVTCEVDELDSRVSVHGDRVEIHCANFVIGTAAKLATILETVWSGLAGLNPQVISKTHSFLFAADMRIRGASYQELLNRLAPAPESLPNGTETAVVYYLPGEPSSGYGESSLVLNRPIAVESGLQVNATLVYEAASIKAAEAITAARNRFGELLRNLGFEWIED
jgi:hypothetical protein